MAHTAPIGIALNPHPAAANTVDALLERARFAQHTRIYRRPELAAGLTTVFAPSLLGALSAGG